jgi:hypothetical protein
MSFGSRATQAKPEALVILFRATTRNRIIYAGDRRFMSVRAVFPGFPREFIFRALRAKPGWNLRTVAQDGAESTLRWRVGVFWRATTNSNMITNMITNTITILTR